MAVVFRLANKTVSATYNFQTGNLRPANLTRTPNGDGWMTTSMTLVARTTDANIISAVNSIDELAETADLYWYDLHQINSVWLEESATSEAVKRSLIQSMELTPLQVSVFTPLLGKTGMQYQLTIVHSAAWEDTSGDLTAQTNTSCLGGTLVLPAIDGSLAGRLYSTALYGDTDNGGHIATIWCGIRPNYGGDSDFSPILELESGKLVAPCAKASDSDEASPKGTTDNVITYACTTGDVKIDYMTLGDAKPGLNYIHFEGDYMVLLRAKKDTTATVRLHIDTGYIGGTTFISGPYNYGCTTDYTFLEMGTVSIPPSPRYVFIAGLQDFEFQLYAMNLGSAVTITADCLILIPSTHYLKITNAEVQDSDASVVDLYNWEDGSITCFNFDGATGRVNLAAQATVSNWCYPIAGGVLVLAGQRSIIQDIDDALYPQLTTFERYRTHGE